MELLDWVFIGLVSVAILCLVFSIISGWLVLKLGSQIKRLKQKRVKKKRNRIRIKRQIRKLERQRKQPKRAWVLFMIVFVLTTGGAASSRYYQSTNLGAADADAIAQGYNLVNQIENQLNQGKSEGADIEKIHKNIYDLSGRLSSYGARKANGRLSKEGQLLLNRLYSNMKELGLNLSNQSVENLQDSELMASYQVDLEKTKQNQKKVLAYFRVDEKKLQESK